MNKIFKVVLALRKRARYFSLQYDTKYLNIVK